MDKVVHFVFHLVILVLGYVSLTEINVFNRDWRKKVSALVLFSLAYGLLIELLQWVMPFDRAAEFWDVMANLIGAITGGLLIQRNRSLIERLK